MKLYLNLSDQAKRIVSCVSNNTNNKPAMVILNTDYNYGKYPKALKKLLNDLGYTERSKFFRDRALTSIKTSDFVVVGEDSAYEEFDYQVVKGGDFRIPPAIENLDGRKFKEVFDIIDDWNEIVKRLAGNQRYNAPRVVNQYRQPQPQAFQRPSGIDMVGTVETTTISRTKVNFAATYRPERREEKVNIFDNWVKIGMKQYDIFVNLIGEEFIKLESGQKLYVSTDTYGRKFLIKR